MLPEKFLERMQGILGEEYGAFAEALGREGHQALRLNPLKLGLCGRSAAGALAEGAYPDVSGAEEPERNVPSVRLKKGFAHLTKVPWAADGYYYEPGDRPGRHPYHEAGLYYIQEPSAMAPAELLDVRPGQRVLDLCAAPGGKTTQIGAKLRGRGLLLCNEIHSARAKILSENVERMGICNACVTNETPERLAELFPGYFDRILVDAPCSGEGMFRRNPEACGEWSPENVALCAERQNRILDCAAGMLRPGGRLVYSTCTFAPEENEGSVKSFLERHEEFSLLPIDRREFIPTNANNCRLHSITSERIGNPELKAAIKCVHEYKTEGIGLRKSETGFGTAASAYHCETEPMTGTVRFWPHRIKGEGHFAAVLQKEGSLPEECRCNAFCGAVEGLGERELKKLPEFGRFCQESLVFFSEQCGTDDVKCGECPFPVASGAMARASAGGAGNEGAGLWDAVGMEEAVYIRFGGNLYLVPAHMPSLRGLKVLRPGLHVGELKKNRFEPSHALALALRPGHAAHIWDMSSDDDRVLEYLRGGVFPAAGAQGWYLMCVDGFSMGWGKLAGGMMKNHYPKGLRRSW